eukprot:g60253.t1
MGWPPQRVIRMDHRVRVFEEIVATEKTYVEQLRAIKDLYVTPLQKELAENPKKPILSKEEVDVLFRNVVSIQDLHQKFLKELEKTAKHFGPETKLSPLFIDFSPYFKTYTFFVNRHDDAVSVLTDILQSKASQYSRFQKLERSATQHPYSKGLGLASLLITPVQRVPRYRLLLTEFQKATEESHADYMGISQALDLVSTVALHINQELHASANRQLFLSIQEELGLTAKQSLLTPSRRFIRKGKIMRVCRRAHKEFVFYLFSDLLLYAQPLANGWKNQVHRKIPIDPASFAVKDLEDGSRGRRTIYRFQIQSSQKSFILYLPSQTEKLSWLQDIQLQIEGVKRAIATKCALAPHAAQAVGLPQHQPVWAEDSSLTDCPLCQRSFTFFRRRHHCRKCGSLCCADCSTKRVFLDAVNPERVRVCDTCYRHALVAGGLSVEEALNVQTGEYVRLRKDAKVNVESILSAQWVWLPHKRDAFVPAIATRAPSSDGSQTFRTQDGEILVGKYSHLEPIPLGSIEQDQENLIHLDQSHLNLAAILHTVRNRYRRDLVYTLIGDILVAVNPFKLLDIYTWETLELYLKTPENQLHTLGPHVYGVAAKAWREMRRTKQQQAVVISGESGAGKTETTKLILQFLSIAGTQSTGRRPNTPRALTGPYVAIPAAADGGAAEWGEAEESGSQEAGSEQDSIEHLLLQSNPLLESLGNAKTIYNHNSSRFGKWVAVRFANHATVCGGEIQTYLLETSRVVHQTAGERNFHVFYQLCAAVAPNLPPAAQSWLGRFPWLLEVLSTLRLGAAKDFSYLSQSGVYQIAGSNEFEGFKVTLGSLQDLRFSSSDITVLLKVVAAVLHLGQLTVSAQGKLCPAGTLDFAAGLLGLNTERLHKALTVKTTVVGLDAVESQFKPAQVAHNRDALAKFLYGFLFTWVVSRANRAFRAANINKAVNAADDREQRPVEGMIGILDIFGFENFAHNSLEQLFINYANEKLQQHFNYRVFQAEMKLYQDEGMGMAKIEYNDNTVCLDLLEGGAPGPQPLGLFTVLNDYCNNQRDLSDRDLLHKLEELFAQGRPRGSTTSSSSSALAFCFWRFLVLMLFSLLCDMLIHHLIQAERPYNTIQYNTMQYHDIMLSQSERRTRARLTAERRTRAMVTESFNPCFSRVIKQKDCFLVHHYPGDVQYDVRGFLAKNKDKLRLDILDTLMTSTTHQIAHMVQPGSEEKTGRATLQSLARKQKRKSLLKKKAQETVAAAFQSQLEALVVRLRRSNTHFVRCLKPNDKQVPYRFESHPVLWQMKSAGLREAVAIRQSGFPVRSTHKDFYKRYVATLALDEDEHVAMPSFSLDVAADAKAACEFLLSRLELMSKKDVREGLVHLVGFDTSLIRVGTTLVLCSASQSRALNSLLLVVSKLIEQEDGLSAAASVVGSAEDTEPSDDSSGSEPAEKPDAPATQSAAASSISSSPPPARALPPPRTSPSADLSAASPPPPPPSSPPLPISPVSASSPSSASEQEELDCSPVSIHHNSSSSKGPKRVPPSPPSHADSTTASPFASSFREVLAETTLKVHNAMLFSPQGLPHSKENATSSPDSLLKPQPPPPARMASSPDKLDQPGLPEGQSALPALSSTPPPRTMAVHVRAGSSPSRAVRPAPPSSPPSSKVHYSPLPAKSSSPQQPSVSPRKQMKPPPALRLSGSPLKHSHHKPAQQTLPQDKDSAPACLPEDCLGQERVDKEAPASPPPRSATATPLRTASPNSSRINRATNNTNTTPSTHKLPPSSPSKIAPAAPAARESSPAPAPPQPVSSAPVLNAAIGGPRDSFPAPPAALWTQLLQKRGCSSLQSLTSLRAPQDFVKRMYRGKKEVLATQYCYQHKPLPRSMIKFKDYLVYVSKEAEHAHRVGSASFLIHDMKMQAANYKALTKEAEGVFLNVLGYCGEKLHAYPSTCAFKVMTAGHSSELLRDEIMVQLIKQSTNNPHPNSRLQCWRLLFICLQIFCPLTREVSLALLSHLSTFASPALPAASPPGADEAEFASLCFVQYLRHAMSLSELQSFDGEGVWPGWSELPVATCATSHVAKKVETAACITLQHVERISGEGVAAAVRAQLSGAAEDVDSDDQEGDDDCDGFYSSARDAVLSSSVPDRHRRASSVSGRAGSPVENKAKPASPSSSSPMPPPPTAAKRPPPPAPPVRAAIVHVRTRSASSLSPTSPQSDNNSSNNNNPPDSKSSNSPPAAELRPFHARHGSLSTFHSQHRRQHSLTSQTANAQADPPTESAPTNPKPLRRHRHTSSYIVCEEAEKQGGVSPPGSAGSADPPPVKFCTHCGNKLAEVTARFCTNCGGRVLR